VNDTEDQCSRFSWRMSLPEMGGEKTSTMAEAVGSCPSFGGHSGKIKPAQSQVERARF